jgi:hypothetical protein
MADEPSDWVRRHAAQIHGNRLLIIEIISYLQTIRPKFRDEAYEGICGWLDAREEAMDEHALAHAREVRRYVGEVLSVADPEAPASI